MERDLRNSGMGINDTIYAGCNVVAMIVTHDAQFPPVGNTMVLAPAFITAADRHDP